MNHNRPISVGSSVIQNDSGNFRNFNGPSQPSFILSRDRLNRSLCRRSWNHCRRVCWQCWTVAEFQAIVQHCYQTKGLRWLGDVCHLLGLTGLRISELAQLRWSDLDFDKQLLTLADESRQGSRSVGTPARTLKNKRNRTLPLHADLLPLLRRLQRQADGRVFHGPLGGKIKPDTVRNILVKQVLTPLLDRFPGEPGAKSFREGRLHSFRHFFCSQCANRGIPEQVVKTWLGHADAAMVRRCYHLDPQESQRQRNRMSIPVVTDRSTAVSALTPLETPSPAEIENHDPTHRC
ncbi:tyrosine-type recombinase/integrase [bacterium]|nr:tyrosine-type recombinase/integrase [bacterium]